MLLVIILGQRHPWPIMQTIDSVGRLPSTSSVSDPTSAIECLAFAFRLLPLGLGLDEGHCLDPMNYLVKFMNTRSGHLICMMEFQPITQVVGA